MANDLENTIEQVQSKLDIAEIVGGYIPLKRAGRNFKACCPFHHEKTPSFVVSPIKQIYHCFGCGAGGDMISFVMKHENLDFIEALKILADKAGVALPNIKGGFKPGHGPRSAVSGLLRVNELAASYYNSVLIGSGKAVSARKYLAQRGLNSESAGLFKIGYASAEWDSFLKFAKTKGATEVMLEKAGLIIRAKADKLYDRFRNRIIFPIFDTRSKIVAFGGRVLDDSLPKYMNSPETDAYVKGRHLYGLNFAIDEIKAKDYVVVVEGYLDLILPFQNGIKNIVATLGTALTIEQIRLIKRFTDNVVIIYDADEAGQAASLRGLDLLVSEGLFVKIASLPMGMDPDSYVRQNGRENLSKIIESADNIFDYKLKLLLDKFNPAESEDKTKIAAEMLPTIKRIENSVLRSDYLNRLSKALFISADVLGEEFQKVKLDYSYLGKDKNIKTETGIRTSEKIVVSLMMEDPSIAAEVRKTLTMEEFTSRDICRIVQAIYKILDEGKIPSAPKIINLIDDEELSHIICEALEETEKIVEREKALQDCICRIKKDNAALKRQNLTNLIRQAETEGDDIKMMSFVKQLDAIKNERV
jgi:DNA primase